MALSMIKMRKNKLKLNDIKCPSLLSTSQQAERVQAAKLIEVFRRKREGELALAVPVIRVMFMSPE